MTWWIRRGWYVNLKLEWRSNWESVNDQVINLDSISKSFFVVLAELATTVA